MYKRQYQMLLHTLIMCSVMYKDDEYKFNSCIHNVFNFF